MLSALARLPEPLRGDVEGTREYVTGCVAALLGLVGQQADTVTDPAAILLARLLGDAFAEGRAIPLDLLIPAVVDPPFQQLGFYDEGDQTWNIVLEKELTEGTITVVLDGHWYGVSVP